MGIDRVDPCSFSEPEKLITKHISLDWTVDFTRKIFKGSATYRFRALERGLQKILLDINNIEISQVHLIVAKMEIPIKFSITESGRDIGDILTLNIPSGIHCGTLIIRITYETSREPSSLFWLSPEQTFDEQYPSVFSHCESIGARSLLPCQDTPAVKFTYTAIIHHPPELTALMSAPNRVQDNNGHSTFEQSVPIPSYLLAIAVGKFVPRPLGPRSNVWAEEGLVDHCAQKLSNTAKILDAAIEICGPYVWEQYDILIVPPIVPFAGMENACLTFLSHAVLGHDDYIFIVVAHEIGHSWGGNLVTNKNFQHVWINEGFATFIEGKITGRLKGDQERDFHAIHDLERLQQTIRVYLSDTPELTKLILDLSNTHPDNAFSDVPYMKGSTFLRHLEDTLGGPTVFEPFLRSYFDHFKYQSIDSNDFKGFLYQYYSETKYAKKLGLIDWDKWFNAEGMPPVIPRLDYSLADGSSEVSNAWNSKSVNELKNSQDLNPNLSLHQIIDILAKLIASKNIVELNEEKLTLLEATYKLNQSKNSEIRLRFFRLCIRARLKKRLDEVLEFVNNNGCAKFIIPIYQDLSAWPEARQKAIENFEAHKDNMAPICRFIIEKELGLS